MCGRVVGCGDFRGSAPSGTHRKTAQTERRQAPFPTIAQPNVSALNSNLPSGYDLYRRGGSLAPSRKNTIASEQARSLQLRLKICACIVGNGFIHSACG